MNVLEAIDNPRLAGRSRRTWGDLHAQKLFRLRKWSEEKKFLASTFIGCHQRKT